MTLLTLAELKGTIDYGIITIRQDEYRAVLKRFPGENNTEGERKYRISDVLTDEAGKIIRVAIVRCSEPGLGEAQNVANDLIAELNPQCLLAVGIAGAIPDDDFSLGDIVIATYIYDFSVEAVLNQGREISLSGGPVPKDLQTLAVSLESYEQQLGDWADDEHIPKEMPSVEYENQKKYYGPDEWQEKVRESLEEHFGTNVNNRTLKVVDGPVASSDRLIKNVEYTQNLLAFIRKTRAVEMEVAGVYRASRKAKGKDYLLTTIRGISDVIGFKRDRGWTSYACHSAAAFTYAFVKSGLLIDPKSIYEKGGLVSTSKSSINTPDKREMIRQVMNAIVGQLKSIKDILKGYVTVHNCDDAIEIIRTIKSEFSTILSILNSEDGIPKTLLPFHDTFLVEYGLEQDGGLNSLNQKIRHLRSLLRTTNTDVMQLDIQAGIDKITRNINALIAHHLS